ncbi:uncharacterized protein [Solanum tuberosum]|uniref:uncharacterized protein n=1 Tax=Solanum tuberosum TaxID=4113 RepID=UPI0003D2496D|nr:PREDICTED: uncharacterized protein LOC102595272 [Solanum tuberosum]
MNLPNETQVESGACSISYQSKTLCINLMNEICHSNNKPYQENTGDGSQQIRFSSIQISDFTGARLVKVAAGVRSVVAASEFSHGAAGRRCCFRRWSLLAGAAGCCCSAKRGEKKKKERKKGEAEGEKVPELLLVRWSACCFAGCRSEKRAEEREVRRRLLVLLLLSPGCSPVELAGFVSFDAGRQ